MNHIISKKYTTEYAKADEEFGFFDFYNNDQQIKTFAIDQKSFNVNLVGFEDINIKFFLIPFWRECYNFKAKPSSYVPYVDDEDDINDSDSEDLVKSKRWTKILVLYTQYSIHSYIRLWIFRFNVAKNFRRWRLRLIQAKNLLFHNILQPQQFLPSDNFFNDFFEDSAIEYAKFIKHLGGFGFQNINRIMFRSKFRKSYFRMFNCIVRTRGHMYRIMRKRKIPFRIAKRTKLSFFHKRQEAITGLQFYRKLKRSIKYLIHNWTMGSTIFIERYFDYVRERRRKFRNLVGNTNNLRSFVFKFPFLSATFFGLKSNVLKKKK